MSPSPPSSVMDAESAKRTDLALSLLDADLAAPYAGWDWQRVPLADLMAMQQLRLMRALLEQLGDSRDSREERCNG